MATSRKTIAAGTLRLLLLNVNWISIVSSLTAAKMAQPDIEQSTCFYLNKMNQFVRCPIGHHAGITLAICPAMALSLSTGL